MTEPVELFYASLIAHEHSLRHMREAQGILVRAIRRAERARAAAERTGANLIQAVRLRELTDRAEAAE